VIVRREIETAHLAGQRRDALSDKASTNKKNLDEGVVKMFSDVSSRHGQILEPCALAG
jgi:hypothetical protein